MALREGKSQWSPVFDFNTIIGYCLSTIFFEVSSADILPVTYSLLSIIESLNFKLSQNSAMKVFEHSESASQSLMGV